MGDLPADRLDSWKEIAAYLNRSVRTVRRWEADEGLPVHRHMHRALGSVYAYRSEIDRWRQAGERRARSTAPAPRIEPEGGEGTPAVAVLPFANLSPDPENEYFADGLTDEIIGDLSKVQSLRVISRTSSMTFKGTTKDVRTIARELAVRYVVEGTVRRAGARLRISARLVDAAADRPLWSDKLDGEVGDVFAMQERLARVLVDALQIQLTPDEDRRLAERPIDNLHAYECYLQARQEALRWRRDAIDHAVQLLHNGLAVVGENAGLYAALGRAHLQYREAGIDFSEAPLREAETCVRKVFALEPGSSAGLQLRGWLQYANGRIQEAVRDLKAALAIDVHNPDTLALLANCYLISGYVAHARPLIARLIAVDPLTPLTRIMPGWADLLEGRLEQALGPYRQMVGMDPGNPMGRLFYVWVLALNGQVDQIPPAVDGFPTQVRESVPARLARFLARASVGDRAGALAELTPEIESAADAGDVFPRFLAHGCAQIGDTEGAIHWLAIAADRGFINYPFLAEHDTLLAALRSDPRFHRLLADVRQRWQAFTP